MLQLERLVLAMAEHEGWTTRAKTPQNVGSVAYSNHNPCNLRRSPFAVGIVNNFAVFNTDMDGFAAARWDIRQKALGNTSTGLNGNSTIKDLLKVWAPTEDGNNPASYLQAVIKMTGFSADKKLKEFLE